MANTKKNNYKKPALGFYWRKLIFFTFLAVVFVVVASSIQTFHADVNTYIPSTSTADVTVNIEITADGSIMVDGQKIAQHIDSTNNFDEMILPILDNSGNSYDSFTANVTVPSSVLANSTYDIKGIHGVDSATVTKQDDKTLVYSATGVGPAAVLSLILDMPKGTVSLPLVLNTYSKLSSIQANVWLVLAIALPLITLIAMVVFLMYQRRNQAIDNPGKETTALPMNLPPAIVGVLLHQTVRSQEIAATLVDLAMRGDIYIFDRERDFAFAKNRYDQRLLSYEKMLLSKIFKENIISNRADVEERINNHLYSRKISLVTSGIYIIATRLGYFKSNPQKVNTKYKTIGLVGFFVGLAGFILSLIYFTNPPYIAFFWVGMMISSIMITLVARNIPNWTPLGRESLSNWLAFQKYLSNPEKIPYDYQSQELFQKYLPYAIVLDCEVAWAKRFSEQNFVLPEWFVSDRSNIGLQDFCLSLFPLVSYVARSLAAIKEPGFE